MTPEEGEGVMVVWGWVMEAWEESTMGGLGPKFIMAVFAIDV